MIKKYYVVHKSEKPGIYHTYKEAVENAVNRYRNESTPITKFSSFVKAKQFLLSNMQVIRYRLPEKTAVSQHRIHAQNQHRFLIADTVLYDDTGNIEYGFLHVLPDESTKKQIRKTTIPAIMHIAKNCRITKKNEAKASIFLLFNDLLEYCVDNNIKNIKIMTPLSMSLNIIDVLKDQIFGQDYSHKKHETSIDKDLRIKLFIQTLNECVKNSNIVFEEYQTILLSKKQQVILSRLDEKLIQKGDEENVTFIY